MTEILEGELIDPDEPDEKSSTTKAVAKFIVRNSVRFVIAGVITNVAPEAETKIQKVKLMVGTYVIADMVAKNTGSYVETKIDGWKQDFQEIRDMVKKIDSESEIPNP